MKNLFKSLLSFVAVAASFVACNPEQPIDVPAGSVISVDLTQEQLANLPAQNVPSVTFNVTSDGEWLATSPAWITIDPSHAKGNATVTITVADNVDADGKLQGPRTGTVTLSLVDAEVSVEITVQQLGDASLDTRRTYKKVTAVTSGKAYLLVAVKGDKNYVPTPLPATYNYGYPAGKPVVINEDGTITMEDASYGLIFADGGLDAAFTIQQPDGRYIWHDGSFNTWSVADNPATGKLWKLDHLNEDGTVRFSNVDDGYLLTFSHVNAQGGDPYTTFACYRELDEETVLPFLYEDTKAAVIDDSKCFLPKTSISAGADSVKATFEVTANIPWTLTKTEGDWVTDFTPTSGEADATITVTFTANESEEARVAKFHLASNDGKKTADLTLTQASAKISTFAEIIAELAKVDTVETSAKNALVVAAANKRYVLYDGTGYTYAYGDSNDLCAAGDVVNVSGEIFMYDGCPEWMKPTFTVVSSNNEVKHPEPVVLDEDGITAYEKACSLQYVEVVFVAGKDKKVGDHIVYTHATSDITFEDGKTYMIHGYAIGYSERYKNTSIVVTDSKEYVEWKWDYEPGADYLADANLWKPIFDGEGDLICGNIAAWEKDVPAARVAGITKEKSTYVFHFNGATEGEWGNCNFLAPAEDYALRLSAGKTYKISYVIGADKPCPRAFIKLTAWSAEGNHEDNTAQMYENTMVLDPSAPVVVSNHEFSGVDCGNISFTIDFGGNPADVNIYLKDLTIIEAGQPVLNFGWTEATVVNDTVAFDAEGAAHWYIQKDAGVEYSVEVVDAAGSVITEGVTIEKDADHIAINYAKNTTPDAKVWRIVATSTSNVENRQLVATLTQGAYEYSDLKEFNEAIIADGRNSVDRILNISADAKLYVTKVNGKYVYAQARTNWFTGGILFYGTGLESKVQECQTLYGKVVATTTTFNGAPQVTKITYNAEDVTFGYDSSIWPCEKVTIAALKADYNKYVNAKCEFNNNYNYNVMVTEGFSSSHRSGKIQDSTGEINVYVQLSEGIAGVETGTKLKLLIAWPTYYNKNLQIGVWSQPKDENIVSIASKITMPETLDIVKGSEPVALGATTNSPAAITYTVDPAEGVLTVAEDGTITLANDVEVGATATITASVAASGKYLAAEATCVVTVKDGSEPQPTVTWVRSSLGSLGKDDVFVFVCTTKDSKTFALSNDKGTGSAPTAVAVTVADGKLSGEIAANIQWTIGGDESGYIFYPNGSTETWLYCTNSNNGVRVGTNENDKFVLDRETSYLKHLGTSRYVGVYNNADWRCYTNTTGNTVDQTFDVYKKVVE